MSTVEAAQRLAVSPRRVRVLWHEGVLSGQLAANRLLLDRARVLDVAEQDRSSTRPLSLRNAWSLLMLLAGERAPWASPSEVSRLRTLAFTREEAALAALVRARAKVWRFDGVASAGKYVLDDNVTVPAGATLAHQWTDLVVDGLTEVYASSVDALKLVDRIHLWPAPQGSIIIHSVPEEVSAVLSGRIEMPSTVVAVDLLESGDPRSRRSGEMLWAHVVQRWRDTAEPMRLRRLGDAR